jgi:hypothetical protein
MSFQEDLKFGNSYEQKLIKQLNLINYEVAPNKKFKDWDIKTETATYEVKTDRFTYKTGNFCIEYECFNKPSGISTTKATYYAYYVVKPTGENLYLIPVNELKQIIEKLKPFTKYVGDYKSSACYLINIKHFEKYLK